MDSTGVSAALGSNNRYGGVQKAIKLARAISKESLVYNHQMPTYNRVASSIEKRGPKPQGLMPSNLSRDQSMPFIIADSEQKICKY